MSRMQLTLIHFDEDEALPLLPGRNEKSGFSDPTFSSNKTLPVHRWVPWIAGFSSEFVHDVLNRFLPSPGVVLDPFAGVGTTLVEAVLKGQQGIGFEVNPYAALAARTKVNAHQVELRAFHKAIEAFEEFYTFSESSDQSPKSSPPVGFKSRTAFYSPQVLRKVLFVQDYIVSLTASDVRDLFRLAFGATMVRYSNYSYEPSLGRRVSAGKEEIQDHPVLETMMAKLKEMEADIQWLKAHVSSPTPGGQVIQGSFFDYQAHLPPASVDLVITSPPYLNNYHYNRNTRPHLYWLGYANSPKDFTTLEQANFGKFWQTVREQDRVNLNFSLPDGELEEQIEAIRRVKPERGIYGGKGWANYAAAYFNDCFRLGKGLQYVLKPNARAFIVIGNSILQGVMIPTDQYLGKIAEVAGLELVGIDIPRATRVGNSIIQSDVRVTKAHDRHCLYEAIVELRRQ